MSHSKLDESDARGSIRVPRGYWAFAVLAVLLSGCPKPPDNMVKAADGCPSPKAPMESGATYAFYYGVGDKVLAAEETKGLSGRCVVKVGQPPASPASPPSQPLATSCPPDMSPSPADAYYVEYLMGNNVRVQLEDLSATPSRCIKKIGSTLSTCPPPAGYHPVTKNGVQYCVP